MFGFDDDGFKSLDVDKLAVLLKQNVELLYKFNNTRYEDFSGVLLDDFVEFANYVDGIVKFDENAKDKLIGIGEFIKYFAMLDNVMDNINQAILENKSLDYNVINLFISRYAAALREKLSSVINNDMHLTFRYKYEKDLPFLAEAYAASHPACPPPTTIISYIISPLFLFLFS